jgi:hypothetical protein
MGFIFVSPLQKSAQIRKKEEDIDQKVQVPQKSAPFKSLFFIFLFANTAKIPRRIWLIFLSTPF